jgi:hypothetical protein
MSKYIISERQFKILVETGSNSAAMDLDRYIQISDFDHGNGNEDLVDEISLSIDNLQELSNQLSGGKKVDPNLKTKIHKITDYINDVCDEIKFSEFTNPEI